MDLNVQINNNALTQKSPLGGDLEGSCRRGFI